MSTLQIKKLQSGAFEHIDSVDGAFFLGRFNFKQEFNKAFLVEAYGAKRHEYLIGEITVYDYLGTAETFTNWTDLENRLVELKYTGIDTNQIFNFIPLSGTQVGNPITGTLSFISGDDFGDLGVNYLIFTGLDSAAEVFQGSFNISASTGKTLRVDINDGIKGNTDYRASLDNFDYVQKIYVDDPETLINTLNNCDSSQLDEIKAILGII